MCGIIGYAGSMHAKDILLDGLQQLEYRGYDSAGLAVWTDEGSLFLCKKAGDVSVLRKACQNTSIQAHCGIGHTRWATHGHVSDENAHPHQSGRITLVHNGIIENARWLKEQYDLQQHLQSETDSEVVACLLDKLYQGDPYAALKQLSLLLTGTYALCILFQDHPGIIFCMRHVSPLVAACHGHEAWISSDLTTLSHKASRYFVVPEHTILTMSANTITMMSLDGVEIQPRWLPMDHRNDSIDKGDFPHYMLKEIYEQPEMIEKILDSYTKKGIMIQGDSPRLTDTLLSCENISILACGTAMYAGMAAKYLLESLLQIPVTVHMASEFRYDPPLIHKNTLTIAISQSGETIDTLAALDLAKQHHSPTLSIVNSQGSTLARESDYVIDTNAGPEIAVASTKAYTAQLITLYLLAYHIAKIRGILTQEDMNPLLQRFHALPSSLTPLLYADHAIQMAVEALKRAHSAFYIGRGLDYALALEGALKLKEITYIHAQAYAAGELKHGTIALIEPGTPVIALATQQDRLTKMLSNVQEVKARGAFVILIAQNDSIIHKDLYDIRIDIPVTEDLMTPFSTAVILQLLAYHTAVAKELNVDKPRNLAKSVTVE